MSLLSVVFIALGLAMDAFAVSVASGVAIKSLRLHHALRVAFFFGLFQAVMPLLGWLAGMRLRGFIAEVDHWVAFVLLVLIGGKMLYESTLIERAEEVTDPLNIVVLLLLSVATSIDALAVGLSFAMLEIVIVTPVLIIGGVTFCMSLAGVYIGDRFGGFFERKAEAMGGVILIAIGTKILIEHLYFM